MGLQQQCGHGDTPEEREDHRRGSGLLHLPQAVSCWSLLRSAVLRVRVSHWSVSVWLAGPGHLLTQAPQHRGRQTIRDGEDSDCCSVKIHQGCDQGDQCPDRREPEYTLFDTPTATLNVYTVKPAVFDLVLSLVICAYLGVIYAVIINSKVLVNLFTSFIKEKEVEMNGHSKSNGVKNGHKLHAY